MSRPCTSVARAILGAVDAPDGALLKCGRELGHEGHHRFLMEWSDPPLPSEGGRLVTDAIAAYLASRRDDPDFRERLAKRMDRDKEILRRLAADDGPTTPPTDATPPVVPTHTVAVERVARRPYDPDHCAACGDFLPCGQSWLPVTPDGGDEL